MTKLKTSAAKKFRKISGRDLFVDTITSKLRKFNDRLIWIEGTGSRKSEYFIYDALFTHLWRAGREKGRKRTGFIVKIDREFISLGVNTEHLKTPFTNLKNHLLESVNPLLKTVKFLEKYDASLSWSSIYCHKSLKNRVPLAAINYKGKKDLVRSLRDEYKIDSIESSVKDFGPRLQKIHTPHEESPARGTTFQFTVKIRNNLSTTSATNLLKRFFPIFNCFYPPIREASFRGSNYRRELLSFYKLKNMPLTCGYKSCRIRDDKNLIASHIQAVQHGGTDDLYNLVFLCRDHSLQLEGASLEDYRKNIRDRFMKHTRL